jgi:coiled-coil domain-containing protein 61
MGRQGVPAKATVNDSFDSDRGSATTASSSQANASKKRYLILTYAVEFDRVHYPLPLNVVEKPTPEILQRTVRRLRQALATATSEGPTKDMADELLALREENRCLKATLKSYCGREPGDENASDVVNQQRSGGLDLQRELEMSMKENKELIAIYQKLREDSSAEMARLRSEIKCVPARWLPYGRGRFSHTCLFV